MDIATNIATAAETLARHPRKRIVAVCATLPKDVGALVARAALGLRRQQRGTKLGRRLRRKAALGMAGAF